jgi:hypothetical protein
VLEPIWVWAAAIVQDVPRIETFWPILTFFMLLVSLWRADKKPILAKIAEAQSYFTKELARVEQEFTVKVTEQRDHIDETLDDYHKTVTGEINGWAKRFEDDHVDIQRHEQVLGDHAGKFIESRSDREQLNRRVDALAREVAENTRETRQLERNLMTQMGEMERRLIDVITGRKRTA